MAAHFGSMLLNRRRELGLSIQQVANTVKIRPQIIEYFETEDFDAMPPRGYAQGMISSYARYLGLSPSEVVNAYYEDLHAFESAASGGRSGRFQDPAADAHTRGSNDAGRYLMVDSSRATTGTSRYGQRPPQAGYVSESTSDHTPQSARSLRHASLINARDPQSNGRPAGSRAARGSASDPSRTAQMSQVDTRRGSTRGGRQENYGSQREGSRRSNERRATGERRREGPYGARSGGQRERGSAGYDERSGRAPSNRARQDERGRSRSQQGRGQQRGARQNNASNQRGSYGRVSGRSGGRGAGGRSGNGGLSSLLSSIDPRIFLLIGAIIVVVVLALLISSIKSCVSSSAQDETTLATTIITTGSTTTDDDSTSSEDDDSTADDEADDTSSDESTDSDTEDADDAETTTVVEDTVVTISVADDAVAYLEVKLDGVTELGEDVVGPEELEYTVTEQIEITTDSPSDVKVYKNGEKVSYDIKTSGVAKVTISADTTTSSSEDDTA